MDNQIFSGGTYIDDMPQVCTLCGAVLNNTMALFSHMQLHILSSNLGGQPPDQGLALNAASILDLLTGGVAQHGVPSSVQAPMLQPQSLYTPVSSVPTRLINPGLDLGLAVGSLQSVPVSHPPVKSKERKSSQSKSQSQSTQVQPNGSSRTSGNSGSFMPSFTKTKESKKLDEPNTPHSKSDRSSSKETFQLTNKFESIEDTLGLALVNKPLFERKGTASSKSAHDSKSQAKDVKLFQPFVTTETTSSSLSFLPKSNHFYTSSGLKSPPRSPEKSKDMNVLNTPQKINPHISDLRNEDLILSTSDPIIRSSLSGESRQSNRGKSQEVNRGKSQEVFDSLFEKMKETPAPPPKTTSSQQDTHLHKTQFYPGILDPLNISPKSAKVFKRDSLKDLDPINKIAQQSTPFTSKPSTSYDNDSVISSNGKSQTAPMISPKIDTGVDLPGNTDSGSNPPLFESRDNAITSQPVIPSSMFGNAAPSTSSIAPVGIAPLRGASPPVLGHTDPSKNPLGSGFFNALTQKLINPGLPIVPDFTKTPSTSTFNNFGSDPNSKGYYENGVLLNHDYDKISETNDEDDLERLIDIDPKEDNSIDSKSIDIIDDILNEFNERTEDANKGNRNQLFDIYNVLDEGLKGKSEGKSDFLSDENIKSTTSFIDELLEKEKEQIDREMRESATVTEVSTSVVETTNIVTSASSTLTFSTSSASSTVTSGGFAPGISTITTMPDLGLDKKKEDDNIDFEIPKVGKLMKIRKYFESQEQKKKEQTQVACKEAEIKIQEKKEPVVEEKPQLQTILVQVSKRKKIEYGPYINRQSLLEGKPKEAETATAASPLKLFRPKPRPQVPTRRTFNLRTRKTTDFASLANKGSKNSDGKKGDGRKGNEKGKIESKDKNLSNNDKDSTDSVVEDRKDENTNEQESKIVTRNKAANKDIEHVQPIKSGLDQSKKTGNGNKEDKSDSTKPTLRTRSNRGEISKSEKLESDGKSLRRRELKPSTEECKVKLAKSNEVNDGSTKVLRSKVKTTPEKNDIKKCSVNLGENLSGLKLKAASLSKVEDKDKQKIQQPETNSDKKLVIEKPNINSACEDKKEVIIEHEKENSETNDEIKEISFGSKKDKCDEIDCISNENNKKERQPDTNVEQEKYVKSQSDGKNIDSQANIFDVMSININENRDTKAGEETPQHKDKIKSETPQPEKKVQVIKLKLGSEIQKSLKEIKESLSLSKKRRFESQKDELQRELDTCTKKVSEIQRQIASHKEAESLKRHESFNGEKRSRNPVDVDEDSASKKTKHSVENEFQRLVNEAVEEVKKAEKSDSSKPERYVNLRKRLNETVKYDVDMSDDEVESNLTFLIDPGASTPKSRKLTPKGSKITPLKFSPKIPSLGKFQMGSLMAKPIKKDMDVYDFTDTELSDKEDATPIKLSSFKPKYVSNVGNVGQKLLSNSFKGEHENIHSFDGSKSDDIEDEISYVGKTVEPLKIKLTKIIPYIKEKKHKHKKKKRKKDKEKKKIINLDDEDDKNDADDDDDDDDSIDSMDIGKVDDSDSVEGMDEELDSVGNRIQGSKKSKLKTKNHKCAFCNQAFSQKCDLKKHEMIHTGERPWPCEICDKKFLRKTDLAKHIRTHTGEKPYKCEFCDKRVSDKSQLNVHRRLHTGSRPYQCTQCGKGCITSSELTRHRSVHCTETSHVCELCKKVFKVKECLGMHMKLHYKSRGKPFKCDKCALGFDQQVDFEQHKCANANPNLFICSECYREFTDELTYAEHIKMHDLDVFSCNICTNIFENKHNLETHLCTMGVVEQQKQFHCEYCDKVFHDQGSLARHIPEHDLDNGSFMCENCPQIFSIRKEFISHSKKHHGANVFICKCGTGFHDNVKAENHRQTCPALRPKDNVRKSASVSSASSHQGFGNVLYKQEQDGLGNKGHQVTGMKRASVISTNTNFKSMESGSHMNMPEGFYPHGASGGAGNMDIQNVYAGKQGASGNNNKIDILDNDKIFDKFEPSDFCNSPDFSSLTDDGSMSLGLNSFQKNKSNFGDKIGAQNDLSLSENQQKMRKHFGPELLSPEAGGRKQKQFQNITSNLQSSHNTAQSNENQWIGSYQMSAQDYVNSLLNKMDTDTGSSVSSISPSGKRPGVKSESEQFSRNFQPTNSMEFKDNIENQAKSDIFSEFDFSVSSQKDPYSSVSKPTVGAKFSAGVANTEDRVDFEDVNPSSFLANQQPTFQDKTDFSSFSNSYLGFPSSSSYSSGSLFGSTGQNALKQSSSNSLFTGDQDLMHNNYFLEVDESMKGTLPTDKSDDAAALLSDFDYDLH